MTLHFAPDPASAKIVAEAKIHELARSNHFLTPLLHETGGHDLVLSPKWHRILYLGLKSLADNERAIESAIDLGWRFFIEHRGEVIAAIEARRTKDGSYRAGPITEGPFVVSTVKAFRVAAELVAEKCSRPEPILLLSPGLHLAALWLRSVGPESDEVLPFAPFDRIFTSFGSPELFNFQPIGLAKFTEVLHEVALLVRKQNFSLFPTTKAPSASDTSGRPG